MGKKKLFDICIGNPPYQSDRQGTSNTAQPVYHEFMDAAYSVSDVSELITPARFLFNAGGTPKEWNAKMLSDKHLKVLKYIPDASSAFPGKDIKGGVAITYKDDFKDFGAIETFTAYPELNTILGKVKAYAEKRSFSELGFVASKFNMENLSLDYPVYEEHERRMSSNVLKFDCFHDQKNEGDILIYGVLKGKRTKKYIRAKYVDLSDNHINKYKIVTPKADGNGTFGDTLSTPEILGPYSGFTHTFLGFGPFESYEETNNALKYIKTKIFRCLLGILKITQDLNAAKFKYIPLQNFTSRSDIDWSKSIHDIDLQLYKKYGLTVDEINFIETHVKEMA